MEDVRCPMCGMQNPSDEEVCSFCNARLKPVQAAPTPDGVGADLPDWLQPQKDPEESIPSIPPQDESLPDWLSSLRDQPIDMPANGDVGEEEQPLDFTSEGAGAGSEIPDWIRDLVTEAEFSEKLEAGQSEDDQPLGEESDWLLRVGGDLEESVEESIEVPEWLPKLEKTSPQVEPAQVPEWYTQEIEDHEAPEEKLPEWLSDIGTPDKLEEKGRETSFAEASFALEEEEELSGWLEKDLLQEQVNLPEQPATPEEIAPPDWLSGMEAEFPELVDEEVAETPSTPASFLEQKEEELPQRAVSVEPEGDLGWLDELEAAFSGFHPETGIPIGEDAATSLTLGEQGVRGTEITSEDTLPAWLSEVASGETELETPMPQGEEDAGLMPAELPSWLKAMRPIEVTSMASELASGVEFEKAEGAGPLAGLKGILPAEPDISQSQKPLPYSTKLQVADVQQAQAKLLGEMISAEGEARPVPARPSITSQHILRVAIAVILFLSILFPLVTGIPQVDTPKDTPEISAVVSSIAGLTAGAPVLLAVDYEPGFSGEMDAIAAAVVSHLIDQDVHLTLVSTKPTGPSQAENLLNKVKQSGGVTYKPDQIVNLGFIPGGPTGLVRFAEAPRQVLPFDISGKPIWSSQALQGVETLSGFAMVVVATENSDTARYWIEQVQPELKGIPLMLVVSAQAEPILRPYYESIPRQVQGMVGGLTSGVAYQSVLGKRGDASLYWSSFSVSMLFAGLLIAIGGMINLAFAYAARRKESRKSEK